MQLYEVIQYEDGTRQWCRTLSEAHTWAKETSDTTQARITLKNYPSDQEAFCNLFNGAKPVGKPLREWCLTTRKGLYELKDGQEAPQAPVEVAEKVQAPVKDADSFWADLDASERARKTGHHGPAGKPSKTE